MYDEYDEYDDGEGGTSFGRKAAMAVGIVALAAAGFFAYKAASSGDGNGGNQVAPGGGTVATSEGTVAPDAGDEEALGNPTSSEPADDGADSTAPDNTDEPATTVATTVPPTTVAPTTTAPPTTAPPTYDTLPDGSPAWVIALFGTDSITLSGAVPDQAAKDRLQALAVANAKPGQAATIDNQLTINPAVPRNVGVRVVELTSVRFPESSAEIMPPHAAELDRVATIMNALPHITALVIGHADQRGNEASNFAISEARADAVTTYLASKGVAPSRLSSRAVGEADLLTLNNDAAAFELNRRTEFIFFGLLIE